MQKFLEKLYVFIHMYASVTYIYAYIERGEERREGERRETLLAIFKNVKYYKFLTYFVIKLLKLFSLIFYILYSCLSKPPILLPWVPTILLSAFMNPYESNFLLEQIRNHLTFIFLYIAYFSYGIFFRFTHLSQIIWFLFNIHTHMYHSMYGLSLLDTQVWVYNLVNVNNTAVKTGIQVSHW